MDVWLYSLSICTAASDIRLNPNPRAWSIHTDDRTVLGDLVREGLVNDAVDVVLPRRKVIRCVRAERARDLRSNPVRNTASARFGVDVRTGAKHDPDACCAGCFKHRRECTEAVIIDVARSRVDRAPVGVEADTVETGGFDLLQDVRPEVGNRETVGVEFARTRATSSASNSCRKRRLTYYKKMR